MYLDLNFEHSIKFILCICDVCDYVWIWLVFRNFRAIDNPYWHLTFENENEPNYFLPGCIWCNIAIRSSGSAVGSVKSGLGWSPDTDDGDESSRMDLEIKDSQRLKSNIWSPHTDFPYWGLSSTKWGYMYKITRLFKIH